MDELKLLSRGAEAKIYTNGKTVTKLRLHKGYRIKEIDNPLIKYRTRREARILDKLSRNSVDSPKLIDVDENKGVIVMEFIHGRKLKDVLNENNFNELMKKVGRLIARIHELNIIHDDLTTSNFLVDDNKKVYLIDFGLSFISPKVEDKAVDLHLFKRALESKHSQLWERAFNSFLDEYSKNYKDADEVIKRLNEKVEKRGRYKRKKK